MKRISYAFNVLINVASGKFPMWLLVLMEIVVLVEVISRYFFGSPLGIADTAAASMLAIMVIMGLGYTWQQKAHVRLEFVTGRLSPKAQTRLRLVTVILGIVFVMVLLKGSFALVAYSAKIDERSLEWHSLRLVWLQMFLVIGFALTLFAAVGELIDTIKTLRSFRRSIQ